MLFLGVMIYNFVYDWMYSAIDGLNDTTYLTVDLETWFTGNNGLSIFDMMTEVMDKAIKPIGYGILGVFFALELYKMSMKIEGAGGNISLGVEPVVRSLIKLAICKLVLDNSQAIVLGINNIGLHCVKVMEPIFDSASKNINLREILEKQKADLMKNNNNIWDIFFQIFFFVEGIVICMLTYIAKGLVKIITMARMVELLIYYTLSPIAIATFPSEEFSQIGKNYLKNVAALSFQGVILYLIITMYSYLVIIFVADGSALIDFLVYAVCITLAATSTGRLSKSMFNAS